MSEVATSHPSIYNQQVEIAIGGKEPCVPIIEWQEKFKLGIEPSDTHHQHLVMLLNTAYDNFVAKVPVAEFGAVLDELVDYATYHFNAEELWMRENGYPKLEEHIEMHNYFTRRVTEIQKDLLHERNNVPLEVLTFLAGWLSNHILVADADFSRIAASSRKAGVKIQL
ncbi:MAG TPA: hemerythrin [Geobacter sp.]|nr:hemerythrin [Geobacter sp.]